MEISLILLIVPLKQMGSLWIKVALLTLQGHKCKLGQWQLIAEECVVVYLSLCTFPGCAELNTHNVVASSPLKIGKMFENPQT